MSDNLGYLRTLAERVRTIAALPIQEERKKKWELHNSLQSKEAMLLVFPEGSLTELIPDSTLRCTDPDLRKLERELLSRIYYHEHLGDDNPITDEIVVTKEVLPFDWGLEQKRIYTDDTKGAYEIEPTLLEDDDANKLKIPEVIYDEESTLKKYRLYQETVGDILPVSLKGQQFLSFHFTAEYIAWRGLDAMLMDFYLNPDLIHRVMGFLNRSYHHILDEYMRQDLLSPNCDITYQSSGGNGYLPCAEPVDNAIVRLDQMWGSTESQEMAVVGPEHHRDFVMKYEADILKRFGQTGYGCCEDLTQKLPDILEMIPNLRRVSISPWADVDRCAEIIGDKVIYSWKPQPAHLVSPFDENLIRDYIRHTVEKTAEKGNILEIILKDTHTCENRPERFDRWMSIAREEIERVWG